MTRNIDNTPEADRPAAIIVASEDKGIVIKLLSLITDHLEKKGESEKVDSIYLSEINPIEYIIKAIVEMDAKLAMEAEGNEISPKYENHKCKLCGSQDIWERVWVESNTGEPISPSVDKEVWCKSCFSMVSPVPLIY